MSFVEPYPAARMGDSMKAPVRIPSVPSGQRPERGIARALRPVLRVLRLFLLFPLTERSIQDRATRAQAARCCKSPLRVACAVRCAVSVLWAVAHFIEVFFSALESNFSVNELGPSLVISSVIVWSAVNSVYLSRTAQRFARYLDTMDQVLEEFPADSAAKAGVFCRKLLLGGLAILAVFYIAVFTSQWYLAGTNNVVAFKMAWTAANVNMTSDEKISAEIFVLATESYRLSGGGTYITTDKYGALGAVLNILLVMEQVHRLVAIFVPMLLFVVIGRWIAYLFDDFNQHVKEIVASDAPCATYTLATRLDMVAKQHGAFCRLVGLTDAMFSGHQAITHILEAMLTLSALTVMSGYKIHCMDIVVQTGLVMLLVLVAFLRRTLSVSKIPDKAQESLGTLRTVVPRSNSERLALSLLTQRLCAEHVALTVSGFFHINKPLILSILGALATYFIVMLQFQGSENVETTCYSDSSKFLANLTHVDSENSTISPVTD